MNEEVQQVAESETATPSESTFDWKSAIPEEVKGNKRRKRAKTHIKAVPRKTKLKREPIKK